MIVGLVSDKENVYDAFDEPEIIPSLIKMIEKVKNGYNKLKQIKR